MITETTGVFKLKELEDMEPGNSRYIMAANGIYYEQHDDLFWGCDNIHEFYRDVNFGSMQLLPHNGFFIPKFPKIPTNLISQCLGFFSHVEDKTKCECGLVLLYDPATHQYSWCCPEQEISKWDLHFTTPLPGKDYPEHLLHFGDIHLHPGMHAYHSSMDKDDEMTASDGLHLVFGTPTFYGKWNPDTRKMDPDTRGIDWCAVFVSDGARFKVSPDSVLETTEYTAGAFPKDWLKKLKKEKKKEYSWTGGTRTTEWEKEKDEGGWKYGFGY